MATLTMKFGGSSVGTTTALMQVVSIVLQEHERWSRLIVVASALDGVTDALLEAAQLAQLSNRRGYRRIIATVRTRHLALVEELPLNVNERTSLQADIDRLLFDMMDICQGLADAAAEETIALETVDAIIGVGEQLAARIIAALIRNAGLRSVALDTTELIITDDHFGSANPDMAETRLRFEQYLNPMLEREIIPVLTGFIGGTRDGRITTLGRGGSDYTSAIVAVCAQVQEVWMWTDVDGMMSTDPREIPTAQVINEMQYDEVAEMAYFGARIVHSRMIGLLQQRQIPMRIKNIYKPQQRGTLIHHRASQPNPGLKAVTSIQGVGLTSAHSGPLTPVYALINEVMIAATGYPAEVTISSQSSTQSFVCVVVPSIAGPNAVSQVENIFIERLKHRHEAGEWRVAPVSIITVIGTALSKNPAITAEIFRALQDIPVVAVSLGPSPCNLSIVVENDDAFTALERLHNVTIQARK